MHVTRFASLASFAFLGYLSAPASGAADYLCIQDGWNLAMSDYSAEASPYCSDLLDIPAVTETVATTTPVVTSIPTSTTYFPVTVRATGTTTITQTVTSVVTASAMAPRLAKRGLRPEDAVWVDRAYRIAAAKAVSLRRRQTNTTDEAQDVEDSMSSLSSACSCLRVVTTTFSVTATASTSTRIISAIDQLDTTTTLLEQQTVLTTVVVTTTTTPMAPTSSSSSTSTTLSLTNSTLSMPSVAPNTTFSMSTGTGVSTTRRGPSSYSTASNATLSLTTVTRTGTATPPTMTSIVTSLTPSTTATRPSSSSSICRLPTPIVNSGFETVLPDGSSPPWEVTASSDAVRFQVVPGSFNSPAFSGERHAQIVINSPDGEVLITQTLNICPNAVYDFRGWSRIPSEVSGCMVEIRVGDYPVAFMSNQSLELAYDEISGAFGPVSASTVQLRILVKCAGSGNGILDLDDITLTLRR